MSETIDADVLEVLRHRPQLVMTSSAVADALDLHRTTVLGHLRDLESRGEVASQQVGARSVVWYLPGDLARLQFDGDADDPPLVIPTYFDVHRRPVDDRGRVTVDVRVATRDVTLAEFDPPGQMRIPASEWAFAEPFEYQRVTAIHEGPTDDRGRIHLDRDRAGSHVSFAVLEVDHGA